LFPLFLVSILASSCSSEPEEIPISISEATSVWNDYYLRDCYAPRDYGTSIYPIDMISRDCTRTALLNVYSKGNDVYCFEKIWQASWKYSDAEGFAESSIKRSVDCHPFTRGYSDRSEIRISGSISSTDLGTLDYWP
jgi:hypothetical protein